MNIPMALTFFRIFAIPVVALLYFMPWPWAHMASSAVFILAAITDWLDGYLARQWGQTTAFGEFLDPVADKLLVVTALLLIVGSSASLWVTLPALVIVGREIAISALREWMAQLGKQVKVSVIWAAKVKTALQMAALAVLLAYDPHLPQYWYHLGVGLLIISALMTLASMWIYLKLAKPDLLISKSL